MVAFAPFEFAAHGAPLLYAAFVWWFSTGAILWLDGRGRDTYVWSFGLACGVGLASLAGLVATADDPSIFGAYAAFTAAIGVWAWHEMSFLMGYITGPRREDCPPGLSGWGRFRAATATLIHHEIALAATVAVILALAWGKPNMVGAWTFTLLWVLRLSSKLNLFFGAPNFTEGFLPAHLSYLTSYLRRAPVGGFFWCSAGAATGLAAWLGIQALAPGQSGAAAAGYGLLFALAALGVLEHLFLAFPLHEAALWRWAQAPAQRAGED